MANDANQNAVPSSTSPLVAPTQTNAHDVENAKEAFNVNGLHAATESGPGLSPYSKDSHEALALFLNNAISTGKLGVGPKEHVERDLTPLRHFINSIPWIMLLFQFVWSVIVTLIAFAIARRYSTETKQTLTQDFWTSLWVLNPSVVYGVGWALFVLLGFFIREAANRYREAVSRWGALGGLLKQIIRQLVQAYPEGSWHPGDHDRMVAHLVAYPILLKMTLRDERGDRTQLEKILSPRDIDDLMTADSMWFHCSRILRAYFCAGEDDADSGFKPTAKKTQAGWCPRYLVIDLVDALDAQAAAAERIKLFRPAAGYSSHLRVFLYIWLLFLPLSIVQTSGWFTPLWSVVITYGIGMLFRIAMNLNDPYGFDLEDIKLNSLCAQTALGALNTYARGQPDLKDVVREELAPVPSTLLDHAQHVEDVSAKRNRSVPVVGWFLNFFRAITRNREVMISMTCLLIWMIFVVFLTWGLATRVYELEPGTDEVFCPLARWWCLYIPLDPSTTAYIGLGIFLLLGFWINDAYGRYKAAIHLWQVEIQRALEHATLIVCTQFRKGSWHPGDRERLLSHIVALPYSAKIMLRDSRDTEELRGILSTRDYLALTKAESFPEHCVSVIFGYLNSAGKGHETFEATSPMKSPKYQVAYRLRDFEGALKACEGIHKFPIPRAFTFHLRAFATVWLAVLPLAFVNHYGFLSFLFLVPVGYSIIKLLAMGTELSDPFGTDENDIPVDMFCDQLKTSLCKLYAETNDGPKYFMQKSVYDRSSFEPKFWNSDPSIVETDDHFQLKKFIRDITGLVPSVNLWALFAAVVWCVIVVIVSYFLRNALPEKRQEDCRAWCSIFDVDGNILLEIGFALFLILSFRASEAIERMTQGAVIFSKIEMQIRGLALDIVEGTHENTWHEADKARLVAHLVQLPLAIRDKMLGIKRTDPQEKEGILSDDDLLAMENSGDPVRHCLNLVHTYLAMSNSSDVKNRSMSSPTVLPPFLAVSPTARVLKLRFMIATLFVMKAFPVVKNYTRHQRVFTGLWLLLLPLSMTANMGFYTILWVLLISYGVLGLESLATKLMDPFGTDSIDFPVDKRCKDISADVLEAVWAVRWKCGYHVTTSLTDSTPGSGVVMRGKVVLDEYSLPQFSSEFVDVTSSGHAPLPKFKSPQHKMTRPTFCTHILHSVPWWILLGAAVWTTFAVLLSYIARTREDAPRWWSSPLRIDPLVGSYVSFAAFMLLGFFVNSAFGRYDMAGMVWGDDLRAACHSFATQIITLAPAGTWHEGDHDRILAHVASIPITLKMELRNDRNLLQLKGLLSQKDVGRIHCAKSMSRHCVDVLRSYCVRAVRHKDQLAHRFSHGDRGGFLFRELVNLEEAVTTSLTLKSTQIAPGFVILLRALLGIWFILLPFVLAESSGWFSILWVTIIAYGVLGMYAVAQELQHPFGTDLNDLDLDRMTEDIVEDILFVQKHYRRGVDTFVVNVEDSSDFWKNDLIDESLNEKLRLIASDVKVEPTSGIMKHLHLARNAVRLWMLSIVAVWAALSVGIAFLVYRYFPFEGISGGLTEECAPAFCSRIAIDEAVKTYVGFALFLLLGFRLYDSHWRYVTAMSTWEDGIIGTMAVLSNRLFESYNEGIFHKGDLERMAAHLAAFPVVTVARLRREISSADILSQFMHPRDVGRIESAEEKGDYCLDVVRGYVLKGDYMRVNGLPNSAGSNEQCALIYHLESLKQYAAKCERMIRIPLPFGYTQHARIFLVIWLLLLPLGLVEAQSWVSIFWCVVIAYGLIGVERWSTELSDPFGTDISDLPLGQLRAKAIGVVRTNLELLRHGTQSLIKTDREGFPTAKTETKLSVE